MNTIAIVYDDGRMDYISGDKLQDLLDNDAIVKFQRNDGWVYPGIDPVRRRVCSSYHGPERRIPS